MNQKSAVLIYFSAEAWNHANKLLFFKYVSVLNCTSAALKECLQLSQRAYQQQRHALR
jgi:hypothetical protein